MVRILGDVEQSISGLAVRQDSLAKEILSYSVMFENRESGINNIPKACWKSPPLSNSEGGLSFSDVQM